MSVLQQARTRTPGFPWAPVLLASVFVLAACGGGDAGEDAAADAAGTGAEGAVRDACEILTGEDVSAILGQALEARPDPHVQGSYYSSCGYYPGDGYGVMYLTVYWSRGQNEWDTWQMATGYAGQMWEEIEKVDLDSISGASLVGGLGDRAYFGGIMPSLVLEDDILLEFKLPLVMDEEVNFPLLAKAALARL